MIVIGGGILGLAAAREALLRRPDAQVLLLEKERELARHQTGRNSGVVHAGVYYRPGSLKARLCRSGAQLLREYCAEHHLPYEECGKLLVATTRDELARLSELLERSSANGVPGVRLLDAAELREIEPAADGIGGLHSPSSAITDYRAVAAALAREVRGRGGEVRLGMAVDRVEEHADGARVVCGDGSSLAADRVLVCAGLQADRLARASGRPQDPRIVPFRGEYWALRPGREHLVRGLIYPVPDPALPFLGVHLTRTTAGQVLVGPNAVPAAALEGYRRRDVAWGEALDTLRWPGARRVARRHWRTGLGELARSGSRRAFARAARRLVPAVQTSDLVPAPAGVRAQAVGVGGELLDDFALDVTGSVVWARNAPSPAATSSLAIARELVERLGL